MYCHLFYGSQCIYDHEWKCAIFLLLFSPYSLGTGFRGKCCVVTDNTTLPPNDSITETQSTHIWGSVGVLCRDNTTPTPHRTTITWIFTFCDVSWLCVRGGTCAAPYLSVLLYAAPALTLQHKQIDELNACWNNVFRKIFGYRRSESVKDVIYGLGRVNF